MLKDQNYLNCKDTEIFMFVGFSVFFLSHRIYNSKLVTNILTIWFDSFSLKSWNLFFIIFVNMKNMGQLDPTRLVIRLTWLVFNSFNRAHFLARYVLVCNPNDPTQPFAMSNPLSISPKKLLFRRINGDNQYKFTRPKW